MTKPREINLDAGIVAICVRRGGGRAAVYHTDPECGRLQRARSVHYHQVDNVGDREECQICARSERRTGDYTPSAALRALKAGEVAIDD